jgi:microcystin-dependent protein
MHRIDGPGAAPGGVFTEGDPAVGTPATVVTDDWLNAVQEEAANLVEAAGLSLAKTDNTQMLQAVRFLIDLAMPVGTVLTGYFTAARPGFVMGRGNLVSRAAYPRLWAHVQAAGLVVADATWLGGSFGLFSSGDGSTTFRLPRLGGQVIRLWDDGAGVDPGRAVGTLQADQNKEHTHGVQADDGGFNTNTNNVVSGTDRASLYVAQTQSSGGIEVRVKTVALAGMIRF